jgi:hypothetical protein
MTITEKIKKTLVKNKKLIVEDPQRLSDFITELQKDGFLIKKQYNLPSLDTVGRQFCQEATPNFK